MRLSICWKCRRCRTTSITPRALKRTLILKDRRLQPLLPRRTSTQTKDGWVVPYFVLFSVIFCTVYHRLSLHYFYVFIFVPSFFRNQDTCVIEKSMFLRHRRYTRGASCCNSIELAFTIKRLVESLDESDRDLPVRSHARNGNLFFDF